MKKVYLKAGECLSLDLKFKISIPKDLCYDEDELRIFLDYLVQKFFRDKDFVKFGETSKL